MRNPIQKFRQSSIVFEKAGINILSENVKTLASSKYTTVQYFLLKLLTRFLLTNVYKSVFGIFFYFVCLDLELLAEIKRPGFYPLVFYILINNSRSN